MENFQKNFINKYSVLFFEKTELENQMQEKDAILEKQRQQLEKLTSKKHSHDKDTQTEELTAPKIHATYIVLYWIL